MDFIDKWSNEDTGVKPLKLVDWLGLGRSKYYYWREHYGHAHEHNAKVPRDHWILEEEKKAVIDFAREYPLEGYRRLTFMMLDGDIVAISPSSTYRILKQAGLIRNKTGRTSQKGKGFVQPLQPHEHWHVDISYINICGTFFYLCSVLDGASRAIVHTEVRTSMCEEDIQIVIQKALENYPGFQPRIISDNGPQFVAKDFKEFIREAGLTHLKTSPYYPQSNGKIERWHQTIKHECIRKKTPIDLQTAKKVIDEYIHHYNHVRLNSAIGYVTPQDKLSGKDKAIFAQRDHKLALARQQRKLKRQQINHQSISEVA